MKLDAEGFLIDDNGNRVLIDGQPVQVEKPFMSQADVDKVVKDRLTRERNKLNAENAEKLEELKAKLEGSVSAEEKSRLEGQIHELQQSLLSAEEKAKQGMDLKLKEEQRRTEEAQTKAADFENRYRKTVVDNNVITLAAAAKFMNPDDALGILSPNVVWEKDDNDQEQFRFKMNVPNKDGTLEERLLTTPEAIKAIAQTKPYLIKGNNNGGAGVDQTTQYTDMSPDDISHLPPQQKMAAGYAINNK